MKKLILLILIPALILTLGGCFVASTRLQVEEAAKIELSSGEGAAVEIVDGGDIQYIIGLLRPGRRANGRNAHYQRQQGTVRRHLLRQHRRDYRHGVP